MISQILVLCSLLGATLASANETATPRPLVRCPPDLPDRYSVQAIRHERNDDRLFCAALDILRGDDPLALRILGVALTEAPFLERIDPAGEPPQDWATLRLTIILEALAASGDPTAPAWCDEIRKAEAITGDPARALVVERTLANCGTAE